MKLLRLKYYLTGLILFAFFSSLYIYTAAPTIYNGDTGEIAAAVNSLGLAHSTGFPLYMLSGKLFTLLFPWGDIAFRLNVYSAFLTAGSVVLLFVLLRSLNISIIPSVLASIVFGLGRNTIWANAGTANVYALTLFLSVLLLNTFVKWNKTKNKKYVYIYSLLFGISLGTHVILFVMAIPLLYMLWLELRRKHIKTTIYSLTISGFPLIQYIYLWFAYKRNTIVTLGDISSFHDFVGYITQRDWADKIASRTMSDIGLFVGALLKFLSSELSIIFFVLVTLGCIVLWKRDKQFAIFVISLALANILIMLFYGNTQDLVILNRYLFIAYVVFAVFLAYTLELISYKCNSYKKSVIVFLVFITILGLQFKLGFDDNNKRNMFITKDFGENILKSAAPNSLIFIDGDLPYGSLSYLQSQGQRRDIIIIHTRLLNLNWYIKNESTKYPDIFRSNLIRQNGVNERLGTIIMDNLHGHNIYTIFPRWEGQSDSLNSLPIGILYQIIPRNADIKNLLISNTQWQHYQLRGLNRNSYKDVYLSNIVNNYQILFNDTAQGYYKIGHYTDAEYLLQSALNMGENQHLRNNLNLIIKNNHGF